MLSKRELFTAAMHSSDRFTITNPKTLTNVTYHLNPSKGEKCLGTFLVNNVAGFKANWITFVQKRIHIEFERADMRDDNVKVTEMLSDPNRDVVEFLQFYIKYAQIWFNTFCAAEGCKEPAKSICGRCRKVKYCCKDCQTTDWKNAHKHSCVSVE
jgi:hypothetical protein